MQLQTGRPSAPLLFTAVIIRASFGFFEHSAQRGRKLRASDKILLY